MHDWYRAVCVGGKTGLTIGRNGWPHQVLGVDKVCGRPASCYGLPSAWKFQATTTLQSTPVAADTRSAGVAVCKQDARLMWRFLTSCDVDLWPFHQEVQKQFVWGRLYAKIAKTIMWCDCNSLLRRPRGTELPLTTDAPIIMRASYRPHYASCPVRPSVRPSVCLSVPNGLLTRKQQWR